MLAIARGMMGLPKLLMVDEPFLGLSPMVVKDLIKQGKTEDEIYNFLSEKYGDWILYKPKFNYENFLLWSFPYLVLVFGGFIVVFLIKRRQKKT